MSQDDRPQEIVGGEIKARSSVFDFHPGDSDGPTIIPSDELTLGTGGNALESVSGSIPGDRSGEGHDWQSAGRPLPLPPPAAPPIAPPALPPPIAPSAARMTPPPPPLPVPSSFGPPGPPQSISDAIEQATVTGVEFDAILEEVDVRLDGLHMPGDAGQAAVLGDNEQIVVLDQEPAIPHLAIVPPPPPPPRRATSSAGTSSYAETASSTETPLSARTASAISPAFARYPGQRPGGPVAGHTQGSMAGSMATGPVGKSGGKTAGPTAGKSAGQTSSTGASASTGQSSAGGGAESLPLPEIGTMVHHYELIRELGRGGMGAVFVARDTRLGRLVAIKFLHSAQEEVATRFLLEARVTAKLQHENVVTIFDVGEVGVGEDHVNQYMVLEYLDGVSLGGLLKRNKTLPYQRTVEIIAAVARGLAAAHERKIVHRDLKPDNIFITDAGTIKVLDFGIAKLRSDTGAEMAEKLQKQEARQAEKAQRRAEKMARKARARQSMTNLTTGATGATGMEGDAGLTKKGAVMGTLSYMSPEQWYSQDVDHRADIWAVGILMFRMLTGRHPLPHLRGWQFMAVAQMSEPMPSIRDASVELPDALSHIIDRCLLKDRNARIGSADELLRLLEPLLPGRTRHDRQIEVNVSPYAGLSAFQESDAARFFGRSMEISRMVTRLRDQPLVGVIGPSGAGKSSFVRAGVVPALKQSGDTWETIMLRPGRRPLAALANVVAPMIGDSGTIPSATVDAELAAQNEVIQRLLHEPGYLGTVLRRRARDHESRILLFVDQFEELYTLVGDERERMAFTACLAGVADDAASPLRAALSIRSDFLDRVSEDGRFMTELSQGLFFLSPPTEEGMREALIQPAEMAGYQFELNAIVDDMLHNLRNVSGALPLLQFTASRLWEARDNQRKLLTEAAYKEMGGVSGALASHADAVLSRLSGGEQHLVRLIFLRLVTPERTRAIVPIHDLYELTAETGAINALVQKLVNARLLVMQTGDAFSAASGPTVEIVHESLIGSWPLLRRWLDEHQDDAVFLEQLRNAAKQWHQRGRPTGLLWRGEAMLEARRWHKAYRGQLAQSEAAYLHAVFALARRSTRVKRAVLAAVIGGLCLMVAAAGVALLQIREANKEAVTAARVAQEAEQEASEQNKALNAEMERREQAEKDKAKSLEDLQTAYAKIKETSNKLEANQEELLAALGRAERESRRAREEEKRAQQSARLAMTAEEKALRSQRKLQSQLRKEQKRLEGIFERLGGAVFTEL